MKLGPRGGHSENCELFTEKFLEQIRKNPWKFPGKTGWRFRTFSRLDLLDCLAVYTGGQQTTTKKKGDFTVKTVNCELSNAVFDLARP